MHEAAERATSQQDTAGPTPEWRALVKRGADFCRRDPARWSLSVRYADALAADGVPREEAARRALDHYDER